MESCLEMRFIVNYSASQDRRIDAMPWTPNPVKSPPRA